MKDLTKEILNNIRRAVTAEKLEGCPVVTWEDIVGNDIPVVPLPSSRINAALGCGGLPCGRVIEIFGPEAGGKTTLALHAIASAQALGKTAAFVDMEHSLSPNYAAKLGVDMDNLIVSQPDTGDDAMSLCKILVENGVDIIVLDSVAALVSKAELDKGICEANVGLQARMMSQGLRQLSPSVAKAGSILIFTNQVRDKISFMGGETTGGGRALKFYASVRMRIGRISAAKDTKDERQTSRVKIVKNKVGAPFRECEVDIVFGEGIDSITDTLLFAKEMKVIKTGGPYMTMPVVECEGLKDHDGNELKFRGLEAARGFVLETEGYLEALKLMTEKAYEQSRGN
jgi:recombination protein RecA